MKADRLQGGDETPLEALAKRVGMIVDGEAKRALSEEQIRPDPELIADGWERRFVADAGRAEEAMELYETPMRYSDFVELCRHRNALHYLLHVDSRRRSPEGAAEAFLRQSAVDFRTAFASWDASLRQAGSPLIAHLDRL